ncbi:hypothetical protein IWX49DRAFT_643031 [Phyllosticta citricarpa]|uniref:Uncharacterized protein n=2 Tax=Phyllosticta TaxID=121621 RepID=A0ABR1L5B7_9PEZI
MLIPSSSSKQSSSITMRSLIAITSVLTLFLTSVGASSVAGAENVVGQKIHVRDAAAENAVGQKIHARDAVAKSPTCQDYLNDYSNAEASYINAGCAVEKPPNPEQCQWWIEEVDSASRIYHYHCAGSTPKLIKRTIHARDANAINAVRQKIHARDAAAENAVGQKIHARDAVANPLNCHDYYNAFLNAETAFVNAGCDVEKPRNLEQCQRLAEEAESAGRAYQSHCAGSPPKLIKRTIHARDANPNPSGCGKAESDFKKALDNYYFNGCDTVTRSNTQECEEIDNALATAQAAVHTSCGGQHKRIKKKRSSDCDKYRNDLDSANKKLDDNHCREDNPPNVAQCEVFFDQYGLALDVYQEHCGFDSPTGASSVTTAKNAVKQKIHARDANPESSLCKDYARDYSLAESTYFQDGCALVEPPNPGVCKELETKMNSYEMYLQQCEDSVSPVAAAKNAVTQKIHARDAPSWQCAEWKNMYWRKEKDYENFGCSSDYPPNLQICESISDDIYDLDHKLRDCPP